MGTHWICTNIFYRIINYILIELESVSNFPQPQYTHPEVLLLSVPHIGFWDL